MNFYNMPKPRRFNYHPRYSDERQERLRRLEERAGEREPSAESQHADSVSADGDAGRAAGYGVSFSRRKAKAPARLSAMNTMQILVIIVVLVAVWRILLSL